MRRFVLLLVILLAVPPLLTACSSKPLKAAYTASGDASRPEDLDKTSVFKPDDDLNVVITLNTHTRDLPVKAVFTAPDGTAYPTDELDMDQTAGVAVLGLDWEMREMVTGPEGDRIVPPWPEGDWKVEIYVDGKREETLKFTVKTPETVNSG
jgi:hypothetical protein